MRSTLNLLGRGPHNSEEEGNIGVNEFSAFLVLLVALLETKSGTS